MICLHNRKIHSHTPFSQDGKIYKNIRVLIYLKLLMKYLNVRRLTYKKQE